MNALVSGHAIGRVSRHDRTMLTETYIEALLVDEGLADQVWDAWGYRRWFGGDGVVHSGGSGYSSESDVHST